MKPEGLHDMDVLPTTRYGIGKNLALLLLSFFLIGCGAGLFPITAHLRILEQGVGVWNQWRVENPEIRPVLAYLRSELEGMSLMGVNFSRTDLSFSNLNNSNLDAADLTDAHLELSQCANARFSFVDLTRAALKYTNFANASLTGSNLTEAHILEVDFTNTELSGANLSGLIGWETISGIENCNIYGISNAPAGFREWALENGAIEFDSSSQESVQVKD